MKSIDADAMNILNILATQMEVSQNMGPPNHWFPTGNSPFWMILDSPKFRKPPNDGLPSQAFLSDPSPSARTTALGQTPQQ